MDQPLAEFLHALWNGSPPVLASSTAPGPEEVTRVARELQRLESVYRETLPGSPPILHQAAWEWGISGFYRACQFLVYRELSEELLRKTVGIPYPGPISPEVCYSVDLTFRFLPDLMRMASAANPDDPLCECLLKWASDWPLSSVGIRAVTIGPVDIILQNLGLRVLYLDRIIAAGDLARLNDPQTANALRQVLGGFRELSPTIYDVLEKRREPPEGSP